MKTIIENLNAMFEEEDSLMLPDARLIKSQLVKEIWANTGAARKAKMQTPEVQAQLSEASKKSWQHPGKREKTIASIKATLAKPESKELKSKISKQLWLDAEYKAKVASSVKTSMQDEDYRKRHSEATKKALANPEAIQKMKDAAIRHRLSGVFRPKFTKEEKIIFKKALKKGPMKSQHSNKLTWKATADYFNCSWGKLKMYARGENLKDLE